MKKKAFTLSEVLITLAVIGIVMAITIPVINNTRPNKDKVFFHKALMSVQQGLDKIDFPEDSFDRTYWGENDSSFFCESFAEVLNTSGKVHCSGTSSYDSPNFITTDGVRFWGFEGPFSADKRTVYVDRKFTKKEKDVLGSLRGSAYSNPGLKMIIYFDGKVEVPDTNEYTLEQKLVESFQDLS